MKTFTFSHLLRVLKSCTFWCWLCRVHFLFFYTHMSSFEINHMLIWHNVITADRRRKQHWVSPFWHLGCSILGNKFGLKIDVLQAGEMQKWKDLSKSKFWLKSQNTLIRIKDSMGRQKQGTCCYPQVLRGADGTWIQCKYTGKDLWLWHHWMCTLVLSRYQHLEP